MPKVHKHILILIAGILWTGVGLFLLSLSFRWFSELSTNEIISALIAGSLLGSVISYFGFSALANKNITRINNYREKVCIWAFQKWTSYILIIFMMSLGIFMRNTPLIPKSLLSPMYIGIGFALFTASFRYYNFLLKLKKSNA
ncbi:MAG: hypothetical protein U9R32_00970 [Bacteroidota bacterium]|nr:hypothetical protein [Bacteroidota bacterium]